jgi:hypothetical protein
MSDAFAVRLGTQKFFWLGLVSMVALLLGYLLASYFLLAGLLVIGGVAVLVLPYHTKISAYMAFATFNSALILPFFPGRPYLWEFAALLAWSGLVITISLREYAEDAWETILKNKGLFIGLVGYCLVLLSIMYFRGVGLRILGSSQMGGRFYFQQLSCAVFPFLYVAHRLDPQTFTRLFKMQCVLTGTFLISDFIFSIAPGSLMFLLQFFEVPGDAVNFERSALSFGIRRFQSLSFISQGILFLTLSRFSLDEILGKRSLYLLPFCATVFGIGLLSGHRYLVMIVVVTLFFMAFSQRLFTPRNIIAGMTFILVGYILAIAFAQKMPMAAQRALSFLPLVEVHHQAEYDAASTLETRRILRGIGMKMIPDYLWLGRGFGQDALGDYSLFWDPTQVQYHVDQGRFFNGMVGLLVNTGLAGTLMMLLFLFSGTLLAFKVMKILREFGCEDDFSRIASIITGLWMANAIGFILLHGDSEYAMKTFSLQAGLLLICHYHLEKRHLAS